MSKPILWIVIPCYNEEQVLPITAPMFLQKITSLTEKGMITQGRGWFTTEFARYEILPEMLVPAVVEQAKKLGNLDEGAED